MELIRTIWERLKLTDYRIRSQIVLSASVWVVTALIALMIVGEVSLDIKSTQLDILLPFFAGSVALALLSRYKALEAIVANGFLFLIYLMVEVHFLVTPGIYQTNQFWMSFNVIIALLVRGPRGFVRWTLIVVATLVFNAYFIQKTMGPNFTIEINWVSSLYMVVIFNTATLSAILLLYNLLGKAYQESRQKSTELMGLKNQLERNNETLARYQSSLLSVARREHASPSRPDQLFSTICHVAADNLDVSRVSIWQISENGNSLVRLFIHEVGVASDEKVEIRQQDFPNYFQALTSASLILAEDARTNPVTREFNTSYLVPNDIYSMLDCPIVLENDLFGVICCEHQGEIRPWRTEDGLFVQSLADLIAISFKNERIRSLLLRVRTQNHELIEKTNEIETMNEELNALNEELSTINESLEATVQKRTQELELQNQQLTEYAFINSHLLRAPLARIQGLSALIASEVNSNKDKLLMESLLVSTHELDVIIRRISDVLYAGNDLTRDDIKDIIDRKLNLH